MRTTARTRQKLIALAAVASSATAAALASYLLLVGPSPSVQRALTTTVPTIGSYDPVTVAALVPTAAVVAGVLLIVLVETTRQAAVARERRRELESGAFEELE